GDPLMNAVCRFVLAGLVCAAVAAPAGAQQPAGAPTDPQGAAQAPQKPDQKPEPKPEEPQKFEETVVVSASRTEEKLINAPATMTVNNAQTIQSAPTQNFAEL